MRSVTAGSRVDGLGVTRSVSRRTTGIASAYRATGVADDPASHLHLACGATYSRPIGFCPIPRRTDLPLNGSLAPAEWWRLASMLAVIVGLHLLGWLTLVLIVDPAQLSLGGKA